MGALVLIPIIAAIVCRIVASRKEGKVREECLQRAKYAIGEFTLYIFMSFSYLAYLSLFIQVKYLNS